MLIESEAVTLENYEACLQKICRSPLTANPQPGYVDGLRQPPEPLVTPLIYATKEACPTPTGCECVDTMCGGIRRFETDE